MLRKVKDYYITDAKVEYSRVINPIVETDGKSFVHIMGVLIDGADGIALKNMVDKMTSDELAGLNAKFPRIKYEKSLDWPIKPAGGSLWSLKLKKRCKTNGQQVSVFTGTSNIDTRTKRGSREITAGATVKISFQPTVYAYEDWGDITSVGVTFQLQAVRIINEPAAAQCWDKRTMNAADFGLAVDSSDEEEYEIFPGLKL